LNWGAILKHIIK
uniref:Panurgin 1 n=1 Tax=Panurgus calcaratus TaxID=156354 RepID=PNG1_PANCL|nr:RecName: Full=Panurgin 1; Short=PNG-1 [Panurgus calcaratus]